MTAAGIASSVAAPSSRSGVAGVRLAWVGLVLLSVLVKVPLAWYHHRFGYEPRDFVLINMDGVAYVDRARAGYVDVSTGQHWLYEAMNSWMLRIVGDPDVLFLAMSLLNVAVSCLIPVAAVSALRHIAGDRVAHGPWGIALFAATLFWPSAVIYATQNMKDTLLALFVAALLATYAGGAREGWGTSSLWRLPPLALLLYGVFALRSYLAAFLAAAVAVGFIADSRHRAGAAVAVGGGAAIVLLGTEAGAYALEFLDPDRNFLFNPLALDLLNEANAGAIAEGLMETQINYGPAAILAGLVRTLLLPFPTLDLVQEENAYVAYRVARSPFIATTTLALAVALVRGHVAQRAFLATSLLLPLGFFAVAQAFSGDRQLYSSVDTIWLVAVAAAGPALGRRTWRWSLIAGLAVTAVLLIYTTLQDA